ADAARALRALAEILNRHIAGNGDAFAPGSGTGARRTEAGPYRVYTSLRAPSTLPNRPDRAKTEWDVALLRRNSDDLWEVCLLIEAKSSVDATDTDLPRLLRGLELFAGADTQPFHEFRAREGFVQICSASLTALAAAD